MSRPKNEVPSRRVTLAVRADDYSLLEAFAKQSNKHPATVALQFVSQTLRAAVDSDGNVDAGQIESQLRALRGEPVMAPRWKWPMATLLGERTWWDRLYPELCKLLGRDLKLPRPSKLGAGDAGPVLNRDGYADLLEFVFPTIAGPRGAVTWRSLDYPSAAESRQEAEDGRPLAPAWEAAIRHVVVALCALEDVETAAGLMLVEDQIRHGWLSTLRSLVGEDAPDALPKKRLA